MLFWDPAEQYQVVLYFDIVNYYWPRAKPETSNTHLPVTYAKFKPTSPEMKGQCTNHVLPLELGTLLCKILHGAFSVKVTFQLRKGLSPHSKDECNEAELGLYSNGHSPLR